MSQIFSSGFEIVSATIAVGLCSFASFATPSRSAKSAVTVFTSDIPKIRTSRSSVAPYRSCDASTVDPGVSWHAISAA
jgi:hypothetical protein